MKDRHRSAKSKSRSTWKSDVDCPRASATTRIEILILLLGLFAFDAIAAEPTDRKPHRPADDVSGTAQAMPSLAEVRAAGTLGSSFRKFQPRTITNATPQPRLVEFRTRIAPILKESCVQCHGSETQEGNIRVDALDPDLLHGADVNWWLEVLAVLNNGEMPPPGDSELSDADSTKVIDWLSSEIQIASTVRRHKQGHSSFRRMAGYEYNYALQDLLGLPYDFAADLPPETASEDGFTNSSEVLQMSSMQFGYYREISRAALVKATVRGDRPEPIYWSVPMSAAWQRVDKSQAESKKKARKPATETAFNSRGTHYKNLESGEGFKVSWSYKAGRYAWAPTLERPNVPAVSPAVAVIPARQKLIVELGNKLPDTGILRVRLRATRTADALDRVPSLRLNFGWQASNNSNASETISHRDLLIDALPGDPQFYEWDIPLSEIKVRNPMRRTAILGKTPNPSEYLQLFNTTLSTADILIDYVEITAPVYEQWPPASHRGIFIDSSNADSEVIYAREVLTNFMSRAWRRTVTTAEVDQKVALYNRVRPECVDFQEAMIEVLATVLSSPRFLYLTHSGPVRAAEDVASDGDQPVSLTDSELASRLSFFLWCGMPDEELLNLAADGSLSNPDVLRAQAIRMLADERAERFSRHFVRQWLGMQLLDFLNVDRKVYRQFDSTLKNAMQEEPVAFFHEMLQHNFSVMDFLHADYLMVNERLAQHYGLQHIDGNHFRRISLTPDTVRGGLLTQAGLLAMNSDGKDSHPLKRGIWLLERILNDPPPPPPPAVPEIDLADPEIAKLTLKQRIENHRDHPACMSCHSKIDPWGIAFENFDAVGSWRTSINDQPVDASSPLFNGQQLDGIDGLKRFLLANRQDQFARAITHKLVTFALGRPLGFGDRSRVEEITADVRKQGDGLATLVLLVVTSDLFRSK